MKPWKRALFFILLFICLFAEVVGAATLTLGDAILLGLKEDHELMEKRAQISELRHELSEGESMINWEWHSDITAGGLVFREDIGTRLEPPKVTIGGRLKWGQSIDISAGQGICVSYSKQLLPYTQNDIDRLAKETELKKYESELVERESVKTFQIIGEYLGLLNLKEAIAQIERDMARTDAMLEELDIKYELGYASKLDILSAEIMYKESQISAASYKAKYLKQMETFIKKLGVSNKEVELQDIRGKLDITLPEPNDLMELAMENSRVLKDLTLDIVYAEASLDTLKRNKGPKVYLVGEYLPLEGRASVYIRGSYAMESQNPREKEIKNVIKLINSLKERKKEEEENIASGITQALKELDEIYNKQEIFTLKMEKAEIEKAAAQERFSHGLISSIDLEQAIRGYENVLKERRELDMSAEIKKLEILSGVGIDLSQLVR